MRMALSYSVLVVNWLQSVLIAEKSTPFSLMGEENTPNRIPCEFCSATSTY